MPPTLMTALMLLGFVLLPLIGAQRKATGESVVPLFKVRGTYQPLSSLHVHPAVTVFAIRASLAVVAYVTWLTKGPPVVLWTCLALPFLPLLIRPVIIPLGIPHVAYWATRTTRAGGGQSDAWFNELLARLRRGRLLSHQNIDRYFRPLLVGDTDRAVRGVTLAALAIRAALAGDMSGARALFGVIQDLRRRHASRRVRVYSQAWLLNEAASRGAYEVLRLSARGPWTPRRYFMRAAASRLLGVASAPGPVALLLLWMTTPGQVSSAWLCEQAKKAHRRIPVAISGTGLPALRESMFEALRVAPGAITRVELGRLCWAWQRATDENHLTNWLIEHASEGGTPEALARSQTMFEVELVELLSRLWRRSLPTSDGEGSDCALMSAVKDKIQFEMLEELESLVHALPHGDARTTDDYENHWQKWARVRMLASEFNWLLPDRQDSLFQAVSSELLNHGAWLYNREFAKMLANDLFRWLLPLCPREHSNYKIVKKNARISNSA